MNGNQALLSIYQTNEFLVNLLWSVCDKYGLVSAKVRCISPINKITGKEKKKVYFFQILIFPYFTSLFKEWYKLDSYGKNIRKKVPLNVDRYLSPLALAHWVMGDGTFDKIGKRIILCTDCFNLSEINRLRNILLGKYGIDFYLRSFKNGNNLVHRITISRENRKNFQILISLYIISSLLYKIGL